MSMDLPSAAGAPVTAIVADQEYTCRRITMGDRASLVEKFRLSRRAELLASLREAGASIQQIVESMEKFDARGTRTSEFLEAALSSDKWALEVLTMAGLDMAGVPVSRQATVEVRGLVCELLGVQLTNAPAPKA